MADDHAAAAARRYSRGAIALHWLTAALFAVQIGLGWRMNAPRGPQTFAVYQLHKSIGITILLLTLARIVWRLTHPAPAFPATMKPWEKALAHITHGGFYALLLALPLTGWLIVSSSATAIPTWLYGTVPWPHVPGVATLAPATKTAVNNAAATGHGLLGWIALALIALHVAGALKHQLLERGDDLARMLPAPRRLLSVAALLIVAAFVGLMAFGRAVPLAPITLARTPPPAAIPVAAPPAPIPARAADAPASPPARAVTSPAATEARATAAIAAPSIWTVRAAASSLRFRTAWSQGAVDGRFSGWKAAIAFAPDALDASAVTVTIDMGSATTADADQQNALPGADWFAVAMHPTATWRATKFRHLGGKSYAAQGTLSLRGVTRPLPLAFTLDIKGDVATMAGTASIDRTVFGVGQGDWAATTDLPAAVAVTIAITADRKK